MFFIRAWKAKQDLEYYYLYTLIFSLLTNIFFYLLIGLESYFFLLLFVIFYYFLIEKTDLRHVFICNFYLFFYFRVTSNFIFLYSPLFYFTITSNFIPSQSPFFYFSVTNNSIPPSTWQSRAYSIFSLATINEIFFIKAIDKIIKFIAEYVRYWYNFFLQLLALPKHLF